MSNSGHEHVASVDNGGGVAAALTLRTITEQQRIINGLQEIVANLKGKVAALERENAGSDTGAVAASQVAALERENAALRGRVTALSRAKLVAEDRCREYADETAQEREARAAVEAELASLKPKAEQWAREAAVAQAVEARCRQLDREGRRVQSQLAEAEVQRRQWRALADVLAARAEPAMQAHAAVMADNIAMSSSVGDTLLHGSGIAAAAATHPLGGWTAASTHKEKLRHQRKKSRFLAPL